jgi:hypothetical protein
MEHVPGGVFGVLHHGAGSMGGGETVVMFVVAGTALYGGMWMMAKLGDAVAWLRERIGRR